MAFANDIDFKNTTESQNLPNPRPQLPPPEISNIDSELNLDSFANDPLRRLVKKIILENCEHS